MHESTPIDTSPADLDFQAEIWRRMSPAEKIALVESMNRSVHRLATAGIRLRHPGASERECALRLAILTLGPDAARRVYPDAARLVER